MELFRGFQALNRTLKRPVVVTIGNFDGVHRGHQTIIGTAVEKARAKGGTSVAYTFRPHPQIALHPGAHVPLLDTYDEKLELMAAQGLDAIVEEPFSREFSTTNPEQFFNEILLRRLNVEAIVVGYDFAFGKGREGHLDAMKQFCAKAGVELTIVSAQRIEGEVASSTQIRRHLLAGDVDLAARLLGREFFYRGVVIKGEGRGRKLGYPTANLRLENKLVLPYGVYATRAVLASTGQNFASVTNVGIRPTFTKLASGESAIGTTGLSGELPALIETHLLDVTCDLYGHTLEVFFIKRLREERRFNGVEELKAQIGRDLESARRLLSR